MGRDDDPDDLGGLVWLFTPVSVRFNHITLLGVGFDVLPPKTDRFELVIDIELHLIGVVRAVGTGGGLAKGWIERENTRLSPSAPGAGHSTHWIKLSP